MCFAKCIQLFHLQYTVYAAIRIMAVFNCCRISNSRSIHTRGCHSNTESVANIAGTSIYVFVRHYDTNRYRNSVNTDMLLICIFFVQCARVFFYFDVCTVEPGVTSSATTTSTPPVSTPLKATTSMSYTDIVTTQPTSGATPSTIASKSSHSARIFTVCWFCR